MQLFSVRHIFISMAIGLFFGSGACQKPQQKTEQARPFIRLKKNLDHEKSRAAYDSLHFFLTEHYTEMSGVERRDLHETLEKYAVWSDASTCSAAEPGPRITLHGLLTDENGKALPGERLHVFHTDHRGYYAPTDSASGHMAENDPRLEGFLITDSLGIFELRSVRPTSYPRKYEGRTIPQHVHFVVEARGFNAENFQVVFEDDPAMKEQHWLDWAKKLRNPVVKLVPDGAEMSGNLQLVLVKK